MASRKQTLLQGTLDLLILKALSAGELHGLGVSRRIEQITGGTFQVQPGVPLSRAASAGGGGLARVPMGGFRKQPAREVLRADQGRETAARRGNGGVERDRARHLASARGITCSRVSAACGETSCIGAPPIAISRMRSPVPTPTLTEEYVRRGMDA